MPKHIVKIIRSAKKEEIIWLICEIKKPLMRIKIRVAGVEYLQYCDMIS